MRPEQARGAGTCSTFVPHRLGLTTQPLAPTAVEEGGRLPMLTGLLEGAHLRVGPPPVFPGGRKVPGSSAFATYWLVSVGRVRPSRGPSCPSRDAGLHTPVLPAVPVHPARPAAAFPAGQAISHTNADCRILGMDHRHLLFLILRIFGKKGERSPLLLPSQTLADRTHVLEPGHLPTTASP